MRTNVGKYSIIIREEKKMTANKGFTYLLSAGNCSSLGNL